MAAVVVLPKKGNVVLAFTTPGGGRFDVSTSLASARLVMRDPDSGTKIVANMSWDRVRALLVSAQSIDPIKERRFCLGKTAEGDTINITTTGRTGIEIFGGLLERLERLGG